MSAVYHKSKNRDVHVQFMVEDWPDDMKISKEAFAEYAQRIEQEDFDDDIIGLSSTLHLLVGARRETINKLRASAIYLDSVWLRCKISKSVGTSASVVGGSLTIAGGILTLTTAGLAAPLLIAGIATSSVGAATNIGTSLIEKIINSKQVKEMGEALTRDKELTLKIESQIESMGRYKDSANLESLLKRAEERLGKDHIVVAILGSVFSSNVSGVERISSKFISEDVRAKLTRISESRIISNGIEVLVEKPTLVTEETDPDIPKDFSVISADSKNNFIDVDFPSILNKDDPEAEAARRSWIELINQHRNKSEVEGDLSVKEERSHSCTDMDRVLELEGIKIEFSNLTFSVPDNLAALNFAILEDKKEVSIEDEPKQIGVEYDDVDPERGLSESKSCDNLLIFGDDEKEKVVPNDDKENKKEDQAKSTLFIPNYEVSGRENTELEKCDIRMSKSDSNLVISDPDATRMSAAGAGTAAAVATVASAAVGSKRVTTKETLTYNPLSPDVFLETGKVVGSNSTRLAGQVIVGVSAAFLAWDVIDLGWTVSELIRKKGSNAGKILRDKADELEGALRETIENYSVEMVWD